MDAAELFRRYRNDVHRLAVSYTHSIQEAEDVCQTVFLKLLEHQDRITPGKERAWLMQVTVNQCRSLLRSAWWKQTVALDDNISTGLTGEDGLRQAVLALAPKYRVVLYLHYYEDMAPGQIGKLLKLSPSAVSMRLSRGREQLRKALEEETI